MHHCIRRRSARLRLAATTVALLASAPASAQTFQFTRLLDLNDINPSIGFQWIGFEEPTLHRSQIAFRADGGVYRSDLEGNVTIIADESTPSPSTGGGLFRNFGQFQEFPPIHNSEVAFVGVSQNNAGLYRGPSAANLTAITDRNERFPGGDFGNDLSFFEDPSFDGRGAVVASGSVSDEGAFIEASGLGIRPTGLSTIVDTVTAIPGDQVSGAPFAVVSEVTHWRGSAFYGALRTPNGFRELRRWSAYQTDHELVTTSLAPIPDAPDFFDFFFNLAIDRVGGQEVCFFGRGRSVSGIYAGNSSGIRRIVDTTMTMPGTTELFDRFGTCSMDDGNVVFDATGATTGIEGVFLVTPANDMIRVLATGDVLDGATVQAARTSNLAIDGNRIAMQVFLSSGEALYVADRTGMGASSPGDSQANPILPDDIVDGVYTFTNAPSDTWIDPPTQNGFRYEMTGGSRFTGILDFPDGFGVPFRVVANDQELGAFGPGDALVFPGGGVTSFEVLDIEPGFDPTDSEAFPLRLAFDTPTASLQMTAVPEPGGPASAVGALLTLCGLHARAGAARLSSPRRG